MSEWDDHRVDEALTRLYQSTTATIVTPEIEVIVARAQRQRTTNIAVMVAVMVAVVGTIALAGTLRRDRALPPIEPSPTFSEPTEDGRVDPSASILAGFLDDPMLTESADASGESRGETPCAGSTTDQLSISRVAGDDESRIQLSLALYDSDEAATQAFASASADLRSCLGFPGATVDPEQWPSYGDESAGLTFLKPADGAGELTGWPVRVVMVRVGRSIETFSSIPYNAQRSEVGTQAATIPVIDAVVRASLPRLCLYKAEDCTPASILPVPLDHFTRGQEVFLVALRVFETDDRNVRPGTVLAVAASAGYHPGIVRQGCDVGGDFADADSAERTRYLALYFEQRYEADAVADELIARDPEATAAYVKVRPVLTRCVS